MTIPDLINGIFEFVGSIAIWYNVLALYRDKQYKGTRISAMAFFTSWGYWNMYYYPHLHQTLSLIGGASIAVSNTAYVSLMCYYYKKNGGK